MEITCEIIIFSLSEVAVLMPTTLNVFWHWNYFKESGQSASLTNYGNKSAVTVSIMSLIGYVLVLFPLMATTIHSEFIQHLMRKVSWLEA